MNLLPINPSPANPASLRIQCTVCGHMLTANVMLADLDAPAGTYVCLGCEHAYTHSPCIRPVAS